MVGQGKKTDVLPLFVFYRPDFEQKFFKCAVWYLSIACRDFLFVQKEEFGLATANLLAKKGGVSYTESNEESAVKYIFIKYIFSRQRDTAIPEFNTERR